MSDSSEPTTESEEAERRVSGLVLKNTSLGGRMLQKDTVTSFTLSEAKSLQQQGLVSPIRRATPSHVDGVATGEKKPRSRSTEKAKEEDS